MIFSIYSLSLLLRIDAVQHQLANHITNRIQSISNIPIEIGSIKIRHLNKIEITSILLHDLSGDTVADIEKLTAHISPLYLLHNKVRINSVMLAKPKFKIHRNDSLSDTNIRFILDLLAGNDSTSESTIPNIRINQLHIYDGRFSYHEHSAPKEKNFSPKHTDFRNISANISLKELSEDTVRLHVRSFSATEASGLHIKNLKMRLRASKRGCEITNLNIGFHNSEIKSDKLSALFSLDQENNFLISNFEGELHSRKFSLSDFASIHPIMEKIPPFTFNIEANGNEHSAYITKFKIQTHNNNILMDAIANSSTTQNKERTYNLEIKKATISPDGLKTLCDIADINNDTYNILRKSGNITLSAEATSKKGDIKCDALLQTENGSIKASLLSNKGEFSCNINGNDINIGHFTNNNELKKADIASTINGIYKNSTCYSGELSTTISSIEYKGYRYSPITLTGSFNENENRITANINDRNISAKIILGTNTKKELPEYDIRIEADSINLQPLNINKDIEDYTVSFKLEADFKGKNIDYGLLTANLYDFELFTTDKYWKIRRLNITDNSLNERRTLFINSDVFNSYIHGYYNYNTIKNSLVSVINRHIPALALCDESNSNNNFVFNIDISNSEVLSKLLNLPITIYAPSKIEGSYDENHDYTTITANINDIEISDSRYKNIALKANSDKDKLTVNTLITKPSSPEGDKNNNSQNSLITEINSTAQNNRLHNVITLKEGTNNEARGHIEFGMTFTRDDNRNLNFETQLQPGNIIYNNNIWNISRSYITGNNNSYKIDKFELSNNNRILQIDGTIGTNQQDSINIDLKDINIEEVMNIVNFHSVDFGGIASGHINISQLLNEPKFNSDLNVKNFKFEKGRMGELSLNGKWNEENKAVLLTGKIDNNNKTSIVDGLISPANDTICIKIDANGANIEFLNNMLSSVLSDVKAEVDGTLFVQGKMSDINLYGALATSGTLRLKPTNVTYSLRGDTLLFTRNKIGFNKFRINDTYGNEGFINGAVNHNSLSRFTCNFNIDTKNLLAYNTYEFGDDGFYGQAFVSGNATFTSNNNGIRLNAEIKTEENSRFVYNAAGSERATNNEFITFVDRNAKKRVRKTVNQKQQPEYRNDRFTSKLRLDLMINTTSDLQLRVYTNTITNDYIDIYGDGPINAIYDDIEGFNMKGNLSLTRGTYKFTLQEIFPKEFSIKEGTLSFNGDPFLANLNLKTVYTVASAPLTDLSMSAEQRKNVKVNCLMDISGTLQSPTLTFGLELPDGNEEEKELLASATSTPEQTNMQFIYLIGIGKFYTYDYNNQNNENSSSSTAMESLISSTISGQLNNMLSQITDNDNWNLSGNFTTSERGWNSMEVEGMLSGRMLNNRLLINGNFGYRDNPLANKNFIGDFEVQWLLNKNGNISLKAYSKTNDRYFSKTTLTTQGAGVMLRHDFDSWLFWRKREKTDK